MSNVSTVQAARRTGGRAARVTVLLVAALFFGIPVLWLLAASTKSRDALLSATPLAWGNPANIATAWSNLLTFNDGELVLWLGNSIIYTAASTLIAVALCLPAGYALAKHDFPFRTTLLVLTLLTMIIPEAALVLPLYLEMNALGLLGTVLSVILPLALFPFGVYLCYLYFATNLPDSLIEAGRLDGSSEVGIFMRIALPTAKPAAGLVAFLCFQRSWTNFFLPFVMLSDDRTFTLQIGLETLLSATGAINPAIGQGTLPIHEPEAALAALVTAGPMMVIFLFAQRYLAAGQMAGAER